MNIRSLIFLSLLALLVGCGTMDKVNHYFVGVDNTEPPAPLTEINQRLNVVQVWSTNIGKGTDEHYLKLTPTVLGNKLFTADSRGYINALDAFNGKNVWGVDTDEPITGGPGAGADLTLVGTREGQVMAFQAETGEKIWQARVSSEVLAAPQAADGVVVARTIDGKIFGLDADTGSRLWIYDRTVPALTLRGTSSPVIASGLVIAGFDGGRLATLELQTGKLIWEARIAVASGRSELDRMVDIDSEPIVKDGVVYVATFQGRIAAVEIETGRITWTRDISSYAGLSVDSKYVYVTDDESHIWALDRFSGSSVWKQEKLHARAATGPASISDYVVVGDVEGYVHWLDRETGEIIARLQLDNNRIIAPPVVSEDMLFAYSSNGSLGAFTYQ